MSQSKPGPSIRYAALCASPFQAADDAAHFTAALTTIDNNGFDIRTPAATPADLQAAAEAARDKLLIGYLSLPDAISCGARTLEQAETLAYAWRALVEEMLRLFRNKRDQITLIDLSALFSQPSAWRSAIAAHYGAALQDEPLSPRTAPDNPLAGLFTLHLMQQHPDLAMLMREIEACSLPVAGQKPAYGRIGLADAIAYIETLAPPHLNTADDALTTLLEEHLSVALEKLAASEQSNQALQTEYEKLLETYGESKALAAHAAHEIKALRRSSSWRITAPLRGAVLSMRAMFGRNNANKAQHAENNQTTE